MPSSFAANYTTFRVTALYAKLLSEVRHGAGPETRKESRNAEDRSCEQPGMRAQEKGREKEKIPLHPLKREREAKRRQTGFTK